MMLATKRDEAVIGVFALGIAAASLLPAASTHREASPLMLVQRLAPVTNLAVRPAQTRPVLTAQQMVTALRDGGMPMSAIAEAARVERKTVYSWLQGSGVRGDNTQRLEAIHALMTGVDGVDVRNLYRFWYSKVDGERTLRDVMASDEVSSPAVREIVQGLRTAALKAMETERKMSRPGKGNPFHDAVPEAVPLR